MKKTTNAPVSADKFEQLSLIPCTRAGIKNIAALDVKPSFKLERGDDGKVVKGADGKSKLALDKKGQPILQSLTLLPKPHSSDKRTDMADAAKQVTGKALVGQQLMEFEQATEDALFEAMLADMRADYQSGAYRPKYARVSVTSGAKTYCTAPKVKPSSLTTEEVKALAEQHGLKVIDVESTVVTEPALSKKQLAKKLKLQAQLDAIKAAEAKK